MTVGVQRQQTLLVSTELVTWRYANAFIFTKQSELAFGIALVHLCLTNNSRDQYTVYKFSNVAWKCTNYELLLIRIAALFIKTVSV
jgi:hypothetical protein